MNLGWAPPGGDHQDWKGIQNISGKGGESRFLGRLVAQGGRTFGRIRNMGAVTKKGNSTSPGIYREESFSKGLKLSNQRAN